MASNMTFKTNLMPAADLTYDLGSTTAQWKINGIANPKLTDTHVMQTNSTSNANYRVLLSELADNTTTAGGAYKSANLLFNPNTKILSVGGDINATGDLDLTGNANLNGETYADSITAGSLLVTGAAAFTNIPTAPTPDTTSNDTSIATTAFVKNNIGGLSGAMHYIGITSTALTDGATTSTLTAKTTGSLTKTTGFIAGDVVLYNDGEYVWNGSLWEQLGDSGSFKVRQTTVSAATTASTATSTIFVSAITQDANGVIKYTTKVLPTATTSTAGIIKIGTGSTNAAAGNHTHSYLPLAGGTMTGPLNFSGTASRALTWNDATWQQRIQTVDDSTADTNVFIFQQSSDGGSNWTDLMAIKDNGKVIATTFIGALDGNASSASTIAITNTTPTSTTSYYLTYASGTSGTYPLRANADLYYYDTSTASFLNVGSNSNRGGLTLHAGNGNYGDIIPSTFTAKRDFTLPDDSGTIALTKDLNRVTQQTATDASGEYPVILAIDTDTTEKIDFVNKTSTLTYDPATTILTAPKVKGYVIAGQKSGTTLGDKVTAEGFNTEASKNYAHAEGYFTVASATASHAEGWQTNASATASHAEGFYTIASGDQAHAEGIYTIASGNAAHAEGFGDTYGWIPVTASGQGSHAEGNSTKASGDWSHAEGNSTKASGNSSHAEGYYTSATASYAHAEGYQVLALGIASHAEGNSTTASAAYSHAEGWKTVASATGSHAEGYMTLASNSYSHAEGYQTTASGYYSHSEGIVTLASGSQSHAEGSTTLASGPSSHAEGVLSVATVKASHAEGYSTTASGQGSHAEGYQTIAEGLSSHSEGRATMAHGIQSHAEGYNTTASMGSAHAEGWKTVAVATASHAEGYSTTASKLYAHAEGWATLAVGTASHAEGYGTQAVGAYSHVEGLQTNTSSTAAHAEGWSTMAYGIASYAGGWSTYASGTASHAEGYHTTAIGAYSHVEGLQTKASATASHAEGYSNNAQGLYSHVEGIMTTASATAAGNHAEGVYTVASGTASHAEGLGDTISWWPLSASGYAAHAEGLCTTSSGTATHAEGWGSTASERASHSEGYGTRASGTASHAEGWDTAASGSYTHAEGFMTVASATGTGAHAEGVYTLASGTASHAEGLGDTVGWCALSASGYAAHAEGFRTRASGTASHAEGFSTTASGSYSHTEGYYTVAQRRSQHVFGEYNILDTTGGSTNDKGSYVEIVGNGVDASHRANVRTLDWSGNETIAGLMTAKSFNLFSGTGTTATGTEDTTNHATTCTPALWKFNTGRTVTDGEIFNIKIPVPGHSNGVFISVDNGANYYPVVLNGTGCLTTHYLLNNYVQVIFEPTASAASMFPVAGATTRKTISGGAFRVINYYDTNTTYSTMSVNEMRGGTATSARLIRADYLKTFLSTLGGSGLTLKHSIASPYLQLSHTNSITAQTTRAVYPIEIDAQGHISAYGSAVTITDTKNTAGSTNSTSKIYMIGATSQAANPQTYSHTSVYATNGVLTAAKIAINDSTTVDKVTLQFNATTNALDFVFA